MLNAWVNTPNFGVLLVDSEIASVGIGDTLSFTM